MDSLFKLTIGVARQGLMCIMAQMSKSLKHILWTIIIASIAGVTIQTVALAQTQTTEPKEPIRLEPITVHITPSPPERSLRRTSKEASHSTVAAKYG
jgi:hypothetical protein